MIFFENNKKKKILVLLGHPDEMSLNAYLADNYESEARASGHEVRRMDIGDLHFDPVLHSGYREIQELEPDLVAFQNLVKWADHIVIFHPVWWGSMPAILKGLFDRVWLPGFAFRFWPSGLGLTRLLKGKTARVFVTTGSYPILAKLLFGNFTKQVDRNILKFAGIKSKVTTFGPAEKAKEKNVKKWTKAVKDLARKGG